MPSTRSRSPAPALREPELPSARLDGPEREIRLLVDHREDLVAERTRIQQRLRWHLHELDPALELPAGCLDRRSWLERIARRLARCEQTAQVEICRELVRRCRELSRRALALERELKARVRAQAARCSPFPAAASDRRQARRRDRWRRALLRRREARDARRRGAASRLIGRSTPPPPEPLGQPSAQLRPTSDRRHPGAGAPARTGVPCSQAERRVTRARKPFAASSATSPESCTARCARSRRRR